MGFTGKGIAVVVLASLAMTGCATLEELNRAAGQMADAAARPDAVTGRRQLNLVSPREEQQLGQEFEKQILDGARRRGFAIDADEKARDGCMDVMKRIVAASHKPDIRVTLHFIEDPTWNACATAGGYVFVNRGLFTGPAAVRNVDELAAVLGHEWGHVVAGHITESVSRMRVDRRAQESAVYAASFSFVEGQEDEADKLGVLYAALAGFDPSAATRVWNRMLQAHGPDQPYAMQVHPLTQDRKASTRRYGELAAQYRVAGTKNPRATAILEDNAIFPRRAHTSGVAALVEAAAEYKTAGMKAQAEAKAREPQQLEEVLVAGVEDAVARALLSIIHPTGNSATLGGVECRPLGSGVRALISIDWRGGLTGRRYRTVVRWDLSGDQHVGSGVDSDNATIGVSASNLKELNQFLRKTLHPQVRSALGR